MTRALVVDGVLAWAMALGGCFPDPPRAVDDLVDTKSGDADVRDTDVTADSGDGAVSGDTSDGDSDTGTPCREDCTALGTGCTEGYCDDGVCRTRPRAGSCDDGLACTADDHCEAGRCVGVAKVCGDASAVCRENVCDPVDGECRERARAEGGACTDGDACTVGDRCGGGADAGVCVHDSVVACAPLDDCHEAGVCNPLSGVCSNPAKADGALCESAVGPLHDEDPRGTCKAGVCQQLPEVSVGGAHVCALFAGGGIKCWGGGGGWLGYGNTRPIGDDPARSIRGLPDVPAPPARKVYASDGHTCALFDDGMRCWGSNDSCLGYPACPKTGATPQSVPSLLPVVPLGTEADGSPAVPIAVSTTWERGCVVAASGGVRCFGFEDDEPTWTPGYPFHPRVNMPGGSLLSDLGAIDLFDTGTADRAVAVVVGTNHNCASLGSGGVRCWGVSQDSGFTIGSEMYYGDDEPPRLAPLTQFSGGISSVSRLCTGEGFTCALVRDRFSDLGQFVQCWGKNESGQLGRGNTTFGSKPAVAWMGFAEETTVDLACGFQFACLSSELGKVRCWGANEAGQLGVGDMTPRGTAPGSLNIPGVALSDKATQISARSSTACAVMRNGRISCWGGNATGQLGIDSRANFGDEAAETQPLVIDFGP
ncbi:MAG: hypothetical protein JNJ59_06510 [Deltaproteobacteria bacterium]|nr:hypothetical protein [Deltaproteobacteria bacterium]